MQWRTVIFLTGCSLFKNTYHTLGGFAPHTPCLSLQCWLPHWLSLLEIYNMGIQLQIVGQLVTTFSFYAIKMGESKHILNSKHKSFCTKASFFKQYDKLVIQWLE